MKEHTGHRPDRRTASRRAAERRVAEAAPAVERRIGPRRRVPSRRAEDFVTERRSGIDRRRGAASPLPEGERRGGRERRLTEAPYYLPGILVRIHRP